MTTPQNIRELNDTASVYPFIVRDAPHTPGRRTAFEITQSLRDTKSELYLLEVTNSARFPEDEIIYYNPHGKLVTFPCSHHHFWQTIGAGTARTYPPRPQGGKGALSRGSTEQRRTPRSKGVLTAQGPSTRSLYPRPQGPAVLNLATRPPAGASRPSN